MATMKKTTLILLAILMAVPALAGGNTYKKKVKELRRAGWEVYASSQTLEEAVRRHGEALQKEGVWEISGVSGETRSPAVGAQVAANDACIRYVQQAGRFLRGRSASDTGSDGGAGSEFSHFYAAYESLLQKEICGEMRHSFTLVRSGRNGTVQVMAFYLVDEEAASRARIRALELAASESEAARQIARKSSEYIAEGFVPEGASADGE